jgi:hypothetical protein
MGNKPSSPKRSSFSLKTFRLRLRDNVSRRILPDPRRSIPLQAPPNPRPYRMRWMTRTHATSPAPSVRSIRGIWRFSNGSLQSIQKHELRIVNCLPPQTPQSIDRCRKCEKQQERYDANLELTTTKKTPIGFAEKQEVVSAMPEKHRSEISRLNVFPDTTRGSTARYEENLKEGPEKHTILWHLEEARLLTSSLRNLGRYKSQIDEPSASIEIRSVT